MWFDIVAKDEKIARRLEKGQVSYHQLQTDFENAYDVEVKKINQGNDLPPGVIKVVKVYVCSEAPHSAG